MDEVALIDCLEVHEAWVHEASRRLKMNYGDIRQFSMSNNINNLSVVWFLNGKSVANADFKAICEVLDFDWEAIQQDPFN